MRILEEYKPLYFDDYLTADCFGGRAGARSYSTTQHALLNILNSPAPMRGFFLREVHSTIYSSMWQDMKDRISEFGEQHDFDLSNVLEWSDNKSGENNIINRQTGSSITTKGFKVSSGNQTANLKSLAGATHVYIDEADEVSKADFMKLKLSLRKKGADLKIIRAFNPPSKDHWIWNDYELEKVSSDGLYRIIRGMSSLDGSVIRDLVKRNNKTYYRAEPKSSRHISINTSFVNNFDNLNPDAVDEYDKILQEDFHYYVTTIAGLIPNDAGDIVYYEYDRHKHHTDRIIRQGDILHVGMDFNVTNMSAVVHVVDGDTAMAISEHTKVFDTHQMCSLLKSSYPGHKIIIYPDASGNNRSTTSGKSDFDTIRSFQFQIISPNQNPPVRDRVNVMNNQFRGLKYLVNRFTCPEYSEALAKIKYRGGEPDKSSGLDHITDSGGYFVHKQYSVPQRVKASFGISRSRR